MTNIREITIFDLLTVSQKTDLILEMSGKRIDFNNLSYEEQEKIILDYLERKKVKG